MTTGRSYQKTQEAQRPLSGFTTPDLYAMLRKIDELRALSPEAPGTPPLIRIVGLDGFALWWTIDSLEFLICSELPARNAALPPRRELVATVAPNGRPYLRLIRADDGHAEPGGAA
jgi:hypothetical protein